MAKFSSKNELVSSEKLALLQSRLKQKGIDTLRGSPIIQRSGTGPWPLSFAQQRLWFLDQLEPESAAYLIALALQLDGVLDIQILVRSLQELVRRHESLRTTFEEQAGQPVQVIHPVGEFAFSLVGLQGLAGDARMKQVRGLAARARRQPFDLRRGPLLRVWLLRLAAEEQVLLITMHHIISDGWSNEIFYRELTTLYRAFVAGEASPLVPLPIQYADFALWQRQWLQGAVLEGRLSYWREQLAGIGPLELPTDHPRPPLQTHRGATQSLPLSASLSQELLAMSQREHVTLFMLLLAAFQVLLARYSGQQDIAVGTAIANRTHNEVEGLIGFFVNTLVMRSQVRGEASFAQFLAQVREMALEAYAHQDVPFERLVEVLQPERDLSRSPFFQVMFSVQQFAPAFETAEPAVPARNSLPLRGVPLEHATTKFDLSLLVNSGPAGLSCGVEYNTDLFEASTIERLLIHWQVLLQSIITHPQQALSQLPLILPEERHMLLRAWNDTQRDYPLSQSFVQLFLQQAALTPSRIAVTAGPMCLTYRDLDQRSNQLARLLQTQNVGPETLVGLFMVRSIEMVVAMLGLFKAGAAYLPLDPSYPAQYLALSVQDAGLGIMITQPAWLSSLPGAVETVICLEPSWQVLNPLSAEGFPVVSHRQQLAYVIYTSGSTGRPKGAMVTQVGLLNHLFAKIEALQLDREDIVAQTASHCFDISVWQFLAVLLRGGQVRIFPDEITHDPQSLFGQTVTQQISILEVVPSLLRAFLDGTQSLTQGTQTSGRLRWLIATGEQLAAEVGLRWLRRYPEVQLLNAYGPTECSDDVTHALLSAPMLRKATSAPIGRALANTHVYLLDDFLEPVPLGIPGYIYVGGVGVGRGYVGDVARTASVFVPDPFSQQAGGRLYKTGDLGRCREDGQIEFIGRNDQQVKVRGYRIALGEIEAALSQHPAVRESVVVVREESSSQEKHLVGYVVASEIEGRSSDALRKYLKETLPDYMIPSYFVHVEALPLSPNGKVDRHRLPWPVERERAPQQVQQEWSPLEELVGQVWSEVLAVPVHERKQSFFELGGHSLLATQVMARIRSVLGVEVPLRALFEAPTIAGLSVRVAQALGEGAAEEAPPLQAVERSGDGLPLSFAQQRLWLLDQLSGGSAAYLMPSARRVHGALNVTVLTQALKELISRHESLRTTFHMHADQPVQVIHPIREVQLPLIGLQALGERARGHEVSRLVQQEARQPCDLTQGPLLRVALLRVHDQEHILLITMHHIISDGWSYTIFFDELVTLYQAFIIGQPSPLPPLPIQYADFAVWQRNWLQGAVLKQHLDYWKKQLAGATPVMLPTDRPRPEIQSYRGAGYSFALPAELSKGLIKLSKQEGVTLFMTLLAAFQTLLYRYTGQTDIVVGTDVANRASLETEALIGFFINLLALRTNFNGPPIFRSILHSVREMLIKSYTHQDIPFETLVEHLRLERRMNYTPLIHVLFVLQNTGKPSATSASVQLEPVSSNAATVKFDIALFMQERSGRITGSIMYSTDIFDHSTIETMEKRFEVLLWDIINRPDTSVEVLDMDTAVDKEERQQKKAKIGALKTKSLRNVKGKEIDIP